MYRECPSFPYIATQISDVVILQVRDIFLLSTEVTARSQISFQRKSIEHCRTKGVNKEQFQKYHNCIILAAPTLQYILLKVAFYSSPKSFLVKKNFLGSGQERELAVTLAATKAINDVRAHFRPGQVEHVNFTNAK